MKRPIETWRGVDPDTVSKCSTAHVYNLVSDAKADLLELHQAARVAVHDARNAISPLVMAASDMTVREVEGVASFEDVSVFPLSKADTEACLTRIRAALDALAKVAS